MLPDGYEARPARREDQSAISNLVQRYDVRDGAVSDFSKDDLSELWLRPRFDMERDTCLILCGGEVVGYSMFWHIEPDSVLNGFAVVDPAHFRRGLGVFLARRIRERVGEVAASAGHAITLRVFAEITDPPALQLLGSLGMEPVRRHYTMLLDLTTTPEVVVEPPYGFELRPCTAAEVRVAHEVFEDSFAEHWGHVRESYEDWSKGVMARDDYDPSLWWLAWEGDKPAGVLVGQSSGELGWIAILGVLHPCRGRGLGAAMLRTSFGEFKKRGFAQVGLGVDASNETGAVALYERVGMYVAKGYETFEQQIGASHPLGV